MASGIGWQECFVEFLGTFLLVFFGCGTAALTGSALNTAVAFGLVLTGLIYVFGPISGGHFNPAVSLGVCLNGDISPTRMLFYWIAQFIGAIVAAAFLNYLFGAAGASVGTLTNTAAGKAVLVEMILTFMFVLVILVVTTPSRNLLGVAGLIIGLTLLLGVLTGFVATGGSLNPARSLGPAIYTGNLPTVWIYFVGPFTGAILAVLIYNLVFKWRPC